MSLTKYRHDINAWIDEGNHSMLLHSAAILHGHLCPQLAQGVRAACLGIKLLALSWEARKDIIAILEIKNGFSDGVQMVTGCSFGNDGLIYRDYGKTAVTILPRRNKEGIRVCLNPKFVHEFQYEYPEATALFKRIEIDRRIATGKEQRLMDSYMEEISLDILQREDEELFKWERKALTTMHDSPVYYTKTCECCGEDVSVAKAITNNETILCPECHDPRTDPIVIVD